MTFARYENIIPVMGSDKKVRGQRKKMGRPQKPLDKKQSVPVTVNMTVAQKKQLDNDAKAAGLSLSAFLLKCWREKRGKGG